MAWSADAVSWTADFNGPRDAYWRPDSPDEEFGLLTGAEAAIALGERHLFYTARSGRNVPQGFLVPVHDNRGYVPAVLCLMHAVKSAAE
ncbi:MAG: hypothetical protein JW929_11675 [Anaerolineales bacterium]|nr:hypothetical protein [Anaerolineales bacterium]